MLTDALSKGGLNVPKLEGPVVDELKGKLFLGAAVGNPIDILATGTPDHLRLCLEYCEEKFDTIDAVLASPFSLLSIPPERKLPLFLLKVM